MSELTPDQRRVLNAIGAFRISGPETIRADLRCAFVELEMLGLIEPRTDYVLTSAGRAALAPADRPAPENTGDGQSS
jgi:hypothetical protein